MLENILIDNPEINDLINQNDYSEAAKKLLLKQKLDWRFATDGFESLKSVQTKEFNFDEYKIKVQFNPGRIKSSSAKVDEISIKERECFLCIENLPAEQKGILINEEYIILVNPFPIFPEHFTIPHIRHIPQSIENSISDLLEISKELSKHYCVFYNGPKCGASAPDHLHFQAGSKNFMPIDLESRYLKNEFGNVLIDNKNINLTAVDDGLRRFILIESHDKYLTENTFQSFYESYKIITGNNNEPMMNILSSYEQKSGWRIIIFLREKHRSSHYFAQEENQMLISPATIDLERIFIIPKKKDFEIISKKTIIEICDEITLTKEKFDLLKNKLQK